MTQWECFCDESYYGLWAVRPIGENRWGYCFHVQTRQEADGLRDLLNRLEKEAHDKKGGDVTLVDSTTTTEVKWSAPPLRMTFYREELIDMARSYVAASYPIAEQDTCNARFGLLVHFILGLFEQEKGGD